MSLTRGDITCLYFANEMGVSSEYAGFEVGMLTVFFVQPLIEC